MKIDLSKYSSFFFDFDGVIVDSLDIKTEAFGELFKEYGRDISKKVKDYHRNNGGVSRYEKFKYYYKNLLDREINQNIINKLDKDYSKLVVKKVIAAPFLKGAITFLKKMNKANKDCFIISGTPQKEIRCILRRRGIDKFFKNSVGSPVNKTRNLRDLLNKYKIEPHAAIFFGDAKSDYEAARDNKVAFVAIINKISKELKEYPCKDSIRDFSRLEI